VAGVTGRRCDGLRRAGEEVNADEAAAMIDLLDRLLRTLFLSRVPELTDETQVRFQPPDEQWRAAVANLHVGGAPAPALNVYLAEIRQDRDLRSTARTRSIRDGVAVDRLAPSWIVCHYLITAWSPGASEQVEPTPDEHALLYRALAALQDAAPINPTRIHPAGSPALAAWPADIRGSDLPTDLLPLEGFGKLAEFWGTMGPGHRWKPVLHVVVGLPVVWTEPVERGRLVSTLVVQVGTAGQDGTRDLLAVIGGRVTQPGGLPAGGAEVALVAAADGGAALRAAVADPTTGRFLLDAPIDVVTHPDRYRLRARLGTAETEASVDLGAPNHDLTLPG
jgi:hypothetical protein